MNNDVYSRLRVRIVETDAAGHVHHANYLIWFEEGREDWLRERNLSHSRFASENMMMVVVHVEADYRGSAFMGDEIEVVTRVTNAGRKKINFEYDIVNLSKGQTIVKGSSVHLFINLSSRKTEDLGDELFEALTGHKPDSPEN